MKNIILFICLFFSFRSAIAEHFVVTSSADSGPGTLREAITKANSNGISEQDSISFNMPESIYNLRLIHLVTELPALSSNIVVDGTTQPGESYGNATSAKVCLIKLDYVPSFTILKIRDAENVRVYGLHLYYGYWQGLFGPPPRSSQLYGIVIENSRNIDIGAPARGNVINGVVHCIYSNSTDCSDIRIRSNFLGQQGYYYDSGGDDVDDVVLVSNNAITFANVRDITIGGPDKADGNIFGNGGAAISVNSQNDAGNGFLRMQHNLFGFLYDGVTPLNYFVASFEGYITIGNGYSNPVRNDGNGPDYRIDLLDNLSIANAFFQTLSGPITLKRNEFRGDKTFFSSAGTKITINGCIGGVVMGDDDEANGNFLHNNNGGINYPSLFIYNAGPVTIGKNVFECNSTLGSTVITQYNPNSSEPIFIQVDETTATYVKGRAAPDVKVDLYYDDDCSACEGKKYLGTTTADATGHWEFYGPITGTVVAMSTNAGGYSSGFSQPTCDASNVNIVYPRCGVKGSITNLRTEGADSYFWVERNSGDTVSTTLDLKDVDAGYYMLFGVHGGTCTNLLYYFSLDDYTTRVVAMPDVTNPSCGLNNGSIENLIILNTTLADVRWTNDKWETIGDPNDRSIYNLFEGTYHFVISDKYGVPEGCKDTLTFVLKNSEGASLLTDKARVVNASCNKSNGSITGISAANVTGTPYVVWIDSLGNSVGSGFDLLNVPAGKYRMKFKDEKAGCDTVLTDYYLIADQGAIEIDTTQMIVGESNCNSNTGSVTGIQVVNGGQYTWFDVSDNRLVSNMLQVYGLEAGVYQLVVNNAYGCTAEVKVNVPQAAFDAIGVTAANVKDAYCGENNGSIEVLGFTKSTDGYTFRWIDSASNNLLGVATQLNGLKEGTYYLFATDSNQCAGKISTVAIKTHPEPVMDLSGLKLTDDECGLQHGSIGGISVSGVINPVSYSWYDEGGSVVGTGVVLSNISTGKYVLKIKDAMGCELTGNPIVIGNKDIPLPTPEYKEVTIQRGRDAVVTPDNLASGTFRLYNDILGSSLLSENNTGYFVLTGIEADTTFYIQRILGSCTSPLAAAKIKVVNGLFAVPNAFSPNGDGLNDIFRLAFPVPTERFVMRVFNRFGTKVFESHDTSLGWNGYYRGEPQPAGTYTYTIEIKEPGKDAYSKKGVVQLIR
ncbi:MAG TPA: gliding motility-associated C-terminal domain-containing protein [Ginsengibacter sp.]|nr:gliding motility-associated C-terminal domain-containing protein [Ginsengibacter sp.]HRP16712.1 gliding motility-associated C-terminal domain-containing protein [Ginsengibacter sp.]